MLWLRAAWIGLLPADSTDRPRDAVEYPFPLVAPDGLPNTSRGEPGLGGRPERTVLLAADPSAAGSVKGDQVRVEKKAGTQTPPRCGRRARRRPSRVPQASAFMSRPLVQQVDGPLTASQPARLPRDLCAWRTPSRWRWRGLFLGRAVPEGLAKEGCVWSCSLGEEVVSVRVVPIATELVGCLARTLPGVVDGHEVPS